MDKIPVNYRRGEEPFFQDGRPAGLKLIDFWSWAYSDVLNNTERGILAEFLVAFALGLDLQKPRGAWDAFDLLYRGKGIEVKSASYHQSWFQKGMSLISFNVPARRYWDAETR